MYLTNTKNKEYNTIVPFLMLGPVTNFLNRLNIPLSLVGTVAVPGSLAGKTNKQTNKNTT